MNQNYNLLNHANIIYRPFKLPRDLGVNHSITWNQWMMHGPIAALHKVFVLFLLLFKNLIIFFFQKKLKVLNMKASSLLLKEKTVLEVINFIVTVFEIPVGGRGTPLSKWHCCQNPQSLPLEFLWYLSDVLADYEFVTQLNHLNCWSNWLSGPAYCFHGIGVS